MIKYLMAELLWNDNKIRCVKPTYYGSSEEIYQLILLLQIDGWCVFVDAPGGPFLMGNSRLFSEFNDLVGLQSVNYPLKEYISV